MSLLSIAFPAEAVLPAMQAYAGAAIGAVRPMVGIGLLAAVLFVFKPLLVGLLRAALLVVRPRPTLEQRSRRRTLQSLLMIHRMARDLDSSDPALAAELRNLAARG